MVFGLSELKAFPWVRAYLCLFSSIRAFILGMGMARGLSFYLPHVSVDLHIGLFAILFVLHWIIVMFYHSVAKWIVVVALLLNSFYALFGRLYMLSGYNTLLLSEIFWFGSWLTIIIDIVSLVILYYNNDVGNNKLD
jgi:hypothetical protein